MPIQSSPCCICSWARLTAKGKVVIMEITVVHSELRSVRESYGAMSTDKQSVVMLGSHMPVAVGPLEKPAVGHENERKYIQQQEADGKNKNENTVSGIGIS